MPIKQSRQMRNLDSVITQNYNPLLTEIYMTQRQMVPPENFIFASGYCALQF